MAKSLSETYRLVNYLIDKYGRPDEIVVELARDLQKTKDEREEATKAIKEVKDRRDVYKKFLKEKLNLQKEPSMGDVRKFELFLQLYYAGEVDAMIQVDLDKYTDFVRTKIKVKEGDTKCRLWMEAGRMCPYTGKMIAVSDLFSGQFEVEHIFPYSQSSDDSMANKTLCDRDFNGRVGNQNKALYIKNQGEPAWVAFQARIKCLPQGKQKRLLATEIPEGFLEKQLNTTRWAARQLRDSMKTIARDVRSVPGGVTAILRKSWGMEDNLFGGDAKEDFGKNRNDHRHHAIDALVIACTRQADVMRLSTLAGQSEKGAQMLHRGEVYIDPKLYPAPPALRYEAVMEKVAGILVSYRKDKRLLVARTNLYRWHKGNKDGGKYKRTYTQRTLTVRGPLHEETIYGRIHNPHNALEPSYVVRKPLSGFTKIKQLEAIIDPALRAAIIKHINENGGEGKMKEILAQPLHIALQANGKLTRVESVRIENPAPSLPEVRPGAFVKPGSNYLIAIYEGPNEKQKMTRDFETISFFEAVSRARNNQSIYSPTKNGKKLLTTLQIRDMVVRYQDNPEEIDWKNPRDIFKRLCKVRLMDKNGIIYLDTHNIAKFEDNSENRGVTFFQVTYGSFKGVKVNLLPDGTITPANP